MRATGSVLDLPCGLPNPLVVELPVEVGDPAVSQRAAFARFSANGPPVDSIADSPLSQPRRSRRENTTPLQSGHQLGWWAPNPGRPRAAGWKAAPKGMARPPARTSGPCSSSLERTRWMALGVRSPNGWNDGVCGTAMRRLMLIPLVALSPIKPEGENPQ